MPTDLDMVVWDLDDAAATSEEPSVIVDPAMEAFCMMRSRMARGSSPSLPRSGRLPLEAIMAYMNQNAEPSEP
jgi:hypothetical protein